MISIIINILIPNLIGIISSSLSSDSMSQYNRLKLPKVHPPGWVFGIVWVAIYIMIGIASHLIWNSVINPSSLLIAYAIYGTNLFFNFMWSLIFFRYMKRGIALLWIIMLDIIVIYNLVVFYEINSLAGMLFIPYILWALFATWLNYSVWRLNKT